MIYLIASLLEVFCPATFSHNHCEAWKRSSHSEFMIVCVCETKDQLALQLLSADTLEGTQLLLHIYFSL